MSSDIMVNRAEHGVALLKFSRPAPPQVLTRALVQELVSAAEAYDADAAVGCIVIAGSAETFAVGADVRELASASVQEIAAHSPSALERLRHVRKPLIAAVSGLALGAGCELALACDMIVASETAQFGQPELHLGLIPGAGGTQRLARQLGRALASEVVLAGRRLSAQEALAHGLVNKVVPTGMFLEEALALARKVAASPPVALQAAKEALAAAEEMGLQAGLRHERRLYCMLFGTGVPQEGIHAFLTKRTPPWRIP